MGNVGHAYDPSKVLSIGMVAGGRNQDNAPWIEAVRALARAVIANREGIESHIKLNVEFHVPGHILVPDFEGVRTGVFRKADSLLTVQAALPAVVPEDPVGFLLGCVLAAVDEAESWAAAQRMDCDMTALRDLVAKLGVAGI
ncbi:MULTISPECIES: hypothetical protein [Arthrobacter]|uniref:Uncharacterized protein n=1 Tax=Arthrobacter terricola TaxID=2547396 RepID=A0A4R5K6P4_9MICC|nr:MULTISPECIES: hypothetical protein [Arthrobacter]MBT8163799.1 hypothetical protein [Arthrobacter sp. GN70]TDF86896.1 hypothetical protein E1809_25415 [Arthrobacter terricola]